MKFINKLSYSLLVGGALMLASCSNDLPEFTDGDAFVAFDKASATYVETAGEVKIPVSLVSLNGLTATVSFNFEDSTATAFEGQHFAVASDSKTLSFTPEAATQYITLNILDNDEYTGDVAFKINLTDPSGVNLGHSSSIKVTISDDEHPLAFMLGEYNAKGTSYLNGGTEWEVTIAKDDTDPTKVWISNMVSGGSSLAIYGTVSDDNTTISIPTGQEIASSSSYPQILFEAFKGEDVDTAENMEAGEPVIGTISTIGDKTVISLAGYCFGSHVYNSSGASAGWYNIMQGDCVLTIK